LNCSLAIEKKNKSPFFKQLGWCFIVGLILSTGCSTVSKQVQWNVVYSRAGGADLMMDVYTPSNTTGARLPVVMYIHGGGWVTGGKSMLGMMPGPAELVRRGYLVVSIDYRLAPEYKFPAMLEDARAAVHFLREHAEEYHLDAHRVGVMGDSAGGHLASLLALMDAGSPDRVQAVVDLYGPSDFTGGDMHASKDTIKLLKDAFGATNADDPILKRASPVTYISSNAPPFLILHGDHDQRVDLKQSVELDARLKAAGVDSTLVVITNFAHGYTPLGLTSTPDGATLSKLVADFFDRNLR